MNLLEPALFRVCQSAIRFLVYESGPNHDPHVELLYSGCAPVPSDVLPGLFAVAAECGVETDWIADPALSDGLAYEATSGMSGRRDFRLVKEWEERLHSKIGPIYVDRRKVVAHLHLSMYGKLNEGLAGSLAEMLVLCRLALPEVCGGGCWSPVVRETYRTAPRTLDDDLRDIATETAVPVEAEDASIPF